MFNSSISVIEKNKFRFKMQLLLALDIKSDTQLLYQKIFIYVNNSLK